MDFKSKQAINSSSSGRHGPSARVRNASRVGIDSGADVAAPDDRRATLLLILWTVEYTAYQS